LQVDSKLLELAAITKHTKPDGTPRKLLDTSCMTAPGLAAAHRAARGAGADIPVVRTMFS
jgi:hypothetical protein